MLTRESSAQVTPASVRLLNVNGVPYFWPLRLSRRAGGASVGGETRYAAALLPAATCCGCGAGAALGRAGRSPSCPRGHRRGVRGRRGGGRGGRMARGRIFGSGGQWV